ncbi:MAG: gamma-glutamyl-gamma-aminobutyrate hydrolase family protein [Armatimonadota bacterium]
MRPLIGITSSTVARDQDTKPAASHVNLAYSESIIRAGGMPVLIPNSVQPEDVDELVALLHGLLLSGGGDVDPAHWGETPHPELGNVDQQRDRLEMALLQAALVREAPVLGICRGIQVMAAALGGELWQDIPSQLPGSPGHFQSMQRREVSHEVRVAPDSPLAAICWPDGANADCRLHVNSFHHQAVRQCGNGQVPIAWSDDEIIEALAMPEARFVLGVQWHPEEMAASDPLQSRLFLAFVQAAAEFADRTLTA